jgi:hypothetical protein
MSTSHTVFRATLFAVGVVNAFPVIGVLGASRLESLYGIKIADSNLSILLQHRAVLFGLIGSFMQYAAFKSELAPAATLGGLASMVSYVLIAKQTKGGYNDSIRRVLLIDVVASLALGGAGLNHYILNGR